MQCDSIFPILMQWVWRLVFFNYPSIVKARRGVVRHSDKSFLKAEKCVPRCQKVAHIFFLFLKGLIVNGPWTNSPDRWHLKYLSCGERLATKKIVDP